MEGYLAFVYCLYLLRSHIPTVFAMGYRGLIKPFAEDQILGLLLC